MSDQHPLTDEICKNLSLSISISIATGDPDPCINPQYIASDMRLAADWQLEQLFEWLKKNAEAYVCQDSEDYSTYFLTDDFINEIKKAMRPTTTQENNQ